MKPTTPPGPAPHGAALAAPAVALAAPYRGG